jgi:thiol-disulfide isomerase/thioredoxin
MQRTAMRQQLGIMLCLLIFSILSCSRNTDQVFHDTTGHSVQLKQLLGKWVIINYWAIWCPACRWEIPELNNFYNNNQDANIVLYGVYYEQLEPDDLKYAINKSAIEFPILIEDPKTAWSLGETNILPTTFILNPKGNVVKVIQGASTEASLLQIIHDLQNAE